MPVRLEREEKAVWDQPKASLLGKAELGDRFVFGGLELGADLPPCTQWFKIKNEAGETLGYAWFALADGEAEIEMCVAKPGDGVGTEALSRIEEEARRAGATLFSAVVRPENSEATRVVQWLEQRGYSADRTADGGFFLTKEAHG